MNEKRQQTPEAVSNTATPRCDKLDWSAARGDSDQTKDAMFDNMLEFQTLERELAAKDATIEMLRAALERVIKWGDDRNFDPLCESGAMLINARQALTDSK